MIEVDPGLKLKGHEVGGSSAHSVVLYGCGEFAAPGSSRSRVCALGERLAGLLTSFENLLMCAGSVLGWR